MHRSYPFSRRIEQRLHFRRRALAAMSAGLAACAVAYGMLPAQTPYTPLTLEPGTAARQPVTVPVSDPLPMARRVYRYSVIPGGAADRAELERVLRTDKVVAAHYAGFEVARARAVTVSAPRAVYVSYRKGDQIYWTSRKVMLQVGETLLTDGRNEMRARCANRISDLPQFPVETDPPRPGELDEPEGGREEITFVDAPVPDGDLPGQPYKLLWPANPGPAENPRPGRRPFGSEPGPGLPSPQTGWFGGASIPPLSRATPGDRLLASNTPPPLSRAITVLPEPGDSVPGMPPPVTDIDPFIPRPDPSRPATPSNPPLDVPPPADVPEPASAWLFAGALLAMLVRRKRR
jgi:hypothetical protein